MIQQVQGINNEKEDGGDDGDDDGGGEGGRRRKVSTMARRIERGTGMLTDDDRSGGGDDGLLREQEQHGGGMISAEGNSSSSSNSHSKARDDGINGSNIGDMTGASSSSSTSTTAGQQSGGSRNSDSSSSGTEATASRNRDGGSNGGELADIKGGGALGRSAGQQGDGVYDGGNGAVPEEARYEGVTLDPHRFYGPLEDDAKTAEQSERWTVALLLGGGFDRKLRLSEWEFIQHQDVLQLDRVVYDLGGRHRLAEASIRLAMFLREVQARRQPEVTMLKEHQLTPSPDEDDPGGPPDSPAQPPGPPPPVGGVRTEARKGMVSPEASQHSRSDAGTSKPRHPHPLR